MYEFVRIDASDLPESLPVQVANDWLVQDLDAAEAAGAGELAARIQAKIVELNDSLKA